MRIHEQKQALVRLKSKHFALCPQKRGGLLGTGTGWEEGGGGNRAPTRKTEEVEDRRQNNPPTRLRPLRSN